MEAILQYVVTNFGVSWVIILLLCIYIYKNKTKCDNASEKKKQQLLDRLDQGYTEIYEKIIHIEQGVNQVGDPKVSDKLLRQIEASSDLNREQKDKLKAHFLLKNELLLREGMLEGQLATELKFIKIGKDMKSIISELKKLKGEV